MDSTNNAPLDSAGDTPPVGEEYPPVTPSDGLNEEEHEAVASLVPELDDLQNRLLLSNAQLRVVLEALVNDIDIDEELAHVGGLSVVEGEVKGNARYRPPAGARATRGRGAPSRPSTARREVRPATSEDDIRARLNKLGLGFMIRSEPQ